MAPHGGKRGHVAPINGIVTGGGHLIEVGVDVIPVE